MISLQLQGEKNTFPVTKNKTNKKTHKAKCHSTDPFSESVSRMMLLVLLSITMLEMSPP